MYICVCIEELLLIASFLLKHSDGMPPNYVASAEHTQPTLVATAVLLWWWMSLLIGRVADARPLPVTLRIECGWWNSKVAHARPLPVTLKIECGWWNSKCTSCADTYIYISTTTRHSFSCDASQHPEWIPNKCIAHYAVYSLVITETWPDMSIPNAINRMCILVEIVASHLIEKTIWDSTNPSANLSSSSVWDVTEFFVMWPHCANTWDCVRCLHVPHVRNSLLTWISWGSTIYLIPKGKLFLILSPF